MMVDFLSRRDGGKLDMPDTISKNLKQPAPATEPQTGPLPIEDPHVSRTLREFFNSQYWPYVRDMIFREIVSYQTTVDRQLQGSLADPADVNGKVAAFHGGRIRGGDEIKLRLERLKGNFS